VICPMASTLPWPGDTTRPGPGGGFGAGSRKKINREQREQHPKRSQHRRGNKANQGQKRRPMSQPVEGGRDAASAEGKDHRGEDQPEGGAARHAGMFHNASLIVVAPKTQRQKMR